MLFLILFLLLVLVLLSYFVIFNNKVSQNKAQVQIEAIPTYSPDSLTRTAPSPTPTPVTCAKENDPVNTTHDMYITDLITDTSNWTTFTLPTEKLSFKFPKNWTIESSTHFLWKDPNDPHNYYDNVTLTSPNGFVLTMTTGAAGLGGGCGEECHCWNLDNYVLGTLNFENEPLYIVTNGVKDTGINNYGDSIMFNVLAEKTCWENLCYGFGSKNSAAIFIIRGSWKDRRYMDPSDFASSNDVKTAVSILKTAVY
jgi:hypothetical protein